MNNNILIIAGMHRSGTSLISHWLNCCGLNIGEVLLGAGIGNVEGHFEDVDFVRFHEDALEANHLVKTGLVAQPIDAISVYQKEKLKNLISFKSKMEWEWGWKDPRTCLFLPHYRELLPHAYYLNIVRDYKSSVSSMIVRDFKHHETKYLSKQLFPRFIWKKFRRNRRLKKFYNELSASYLKVWITYNDEIVKNIQSLDDDKYIVIDYKSLYNNDKDIFNHLNNDWHFNLNYYDFKKVFKGNLLSPPVDIDLAVMDKSLLTRAQELEKQLNELSKKKNPFAEKVA